MIRVSASAFDVLWSDLGHTHSPRPLAVHSVGRTGQERAGIRAEVYANLAERGLVRGGDVDPELCRRLDVLAGATLTVECEALLDLADAEPLRAVAAAAGERGVLAVQPRRTIALTAIRGAEVFGAAVSVLPDFAAGPGMGVSLPSSALATVADAAVEHSQTRRARVFEQQSREVLAVQSRPVLAAGQLSVRLRCEARLRRVGGVSWFVTDEGGYLGTVAEGRASEPWLSLVPADPARIAGRLADLVEEAGSCA
ncbi:ESX secretion-associated protein EspG [Saccharomonospora xinjiangensis]|uniref:EspG family n=1 Tax=Saccharomonospora xinjiangensis XJ-54 TaxID=882086 RepID=I0V6X2_9PSEU|nr:ESX secretion-associated protein EspG [Saccharomonospora xinjiangensis]EID55875.1 hypothetical protein SacxiDRAFT_3682 [Saccharomonospora xinjiangensis XJ-54]